VKDWLKREEILSLSNRQPNGSLNTAATRSGGVFVLAPFLFYFVRRSTRGKSDSDTLCCKFDLSATSFTAVRNEAVSNPK
jgi:hypothetical protein